MSDFLDLQEGKYKIISELGHNSLGGRVTYLAEEIANNCQVVIKQFQFAQLGTNWQEYETYQQELKMLRSLNHPSIPRYLDSFSTPNGFCLVQEYIEAVPLTTQRNWTPDGIRKLALAILDILIYLQQQQPCIIHRDLKPENILIGEEEKVYLVDFGFARSGGGAVAVSSVVKGTLGFMPPEQLFNRQLTEAADLYGLGMTLICLLTGTNSAAIGNLIDANYYVHFRHLVPSGARGWLNWLEKLVEANLQERFANAVEAKEALQEIDTTRLPKSRLSRESLYIEAKNWGDKVTGTIEVTNPIPGTLLSGCWEVAAHKSDPPHTPYDHSWIKVHPLKFSSNQQRCKVEVDSSKLLAKKTYERQLILHSNSGEDSQVVELTIRTQKLPALPRLHYSSLVGVAGIYFIGMLLFIGFYIDKLNNPFLNQFFWLNGFHLNWLFIPFFWGLILGTPIHHYFLSMNAIKNKLSLFVGTFLWDMLMGNLIVKTIPSLSLETILLTLIFFSIVFLAVATYFEVELEGVKLKDIELNHGIGYGWGVAGLLVSTDHHFQINYFLSREATLFFTATFLFFVGYHLGYILLKNAQNKQKDNLDCSFSQATSISLLTAGLGASIGAAILGVVIYFLTSQGMLSVFNLQQQLIILFLTSIPIIIHGRLLSKLIIFEPRRIKRKITDYQVRQEQLIKS